jgi:hypothetical protein
VRGEACASGSQGLFPRASCGPSPVGDDAEADPAVHSDIALVAAAVEAMSPFDDADASLASSAAKGASELPAHRIRNVNGCCQEFRDQNPAGFQDMAEKGRSQC